MRITRKFDVVLKLAIAVLTLLTGVMIYLYFQVDRVLLSTRSEMVEMIVDRYLMGLTNATKMVRDKVGDRPLVEALQRSVELRRELERDLRYFKTDEIDNIFVVYRDARGRFRYLLDAEKRPEERAMFRQRFEPVSDVWERAYAAKRPQIHKHMREGSLWITLAIPILQNDKVAGVLGCDLSAVIRSDVESRFAQIKTIMFGVATVIVFLLVFGYIQAFYYFRGRSKSFIDPLTGAENRKFLYEVLSKEEFRNYHIILYDVDHFKKVNDTYGHDVGDEVLRTLTIRIRKMLRNEDHLIRYGGEEFIIFVRSDDPRKTVEIAERIKKSIETSPFVIGKNILAITISLGVNCDVANAQNVDEAIERADESLYCAKNAGRNRVCVNGELVS